MNVLWHRSHGYGFFSRCMCSWIESEESMVNAFPQMLHWNGFSSWGWIKIRFCGFKDFFRLSQHYFCLKKLCDSQFKMVKWSDSKLRVLGVFTVCDSQLIMVQWCDSHLMNQFMYPQMSMMYKLSFTNTAHVRPLLEVSSLMPPQTFNPGKALITNVTTVRLLSSVNVLMPPQVAQVFEAKAAAVADIRFFTGVDPFMDFEVLFLSESFTTAAAFVRPLSW